MTPRFRTTLKVEKIGEDRWRLTAPLIYVSTILGEIIVPEGFVTDFASVPRLPFAYLLAGNVGHAPSTVHDYLYQCQCTDRATADAVFHEILGVDSVPWWRRLIMYAAVRTLGWASWLQGPDRLATLNPTMGDDG